MKKGFESGRSMTEMLGVLAIIGVLSIGGIIAYKMGINKQKADDISQAVRIDLVQIQTAESPENLSSLEVTEAGNATLSFFDAGADREHEKAGVKINFGDDNEAVCKQFYDMYKNHPDYIVKVKCGGKMME